MTGMSTGQFVCNDEQGIDDALRDLVVLEESLADEVAQLRSSHAPDRREAEQVCYGGRALWWWRFKLMTWIYAREARSAGAANLLRGLRLALKQWDDTELLGFLRQLGRLAALRQHQRRGGSA